MSNLPTRQKDARLAGVALYFTGKACKRGHISNRHSGNGQCVECRLELRKAQYERNREAAIADAIRWNKTNSERRKEICKKWYEENKEKHNAYNAEWREQNKDYHRALIADWKERNKGRMAASVRKRQAAKIKRSITLSARHEQDMVHVYNQCALLRHLGYDYHVDHIVPLQSAVVSGLHVPWNLQVIPAQQNYAKSNSLIQ